MSSADSTNSTASELDKDSLFFGKGITPLLGHVMLSSVMLSSVMVSGMLPTVALAQTQVDIAAPQMLQELQTQTQAVATEITQRGSQSPTVLQWLDDNRDQIKQGLDGYAQGVDEYLTGMRASQPLDQDDTSSSSSIVSKGDRASASVRFYIDNSWNEYDGFDTKVRVRGRLDLPNTERRLKVVFGDESLDTEQSVDHFPMQTDPSTTVRGNETQGEADSSSGSQLREIRRDAVDRNNSLALRVSREIERSTGGVIDIDTDVGIRSGIKDIFIRTRGEFAQNLAEDRRLYLRQTLRYGSKSRFYSNTQAEVVQPSGSQLFHSQSSHYSWLNSLTYEETKQPAGAHWLSRWSHNHQYSKNRNFAYGVLVSGQVGRADAGVHYYGPWISYSQPVLRDWIIVETHANYLRDEHKHKDWYPSAFVRLALHY